MAGETQVPQILALQGAGRAELRSVLAEACARWSAGGHRVLGVIEHVPPDAGADVVLLQDLSSGALHPLNQDLGPGAAGCSLDPRGLAAACAGVESAIAAAVAEGAHAANTVVVLSKFGRQEADGSGLTHAFHAAVAAELPVLTSVSPAVAQAWADFAGPMADFGAPYPATVDAWLAAWQKSTG